ncbi:MAG: stage III sporulation protein AG [Lachnospiraceae bacterium]|nr:stage III sporulation protein AG [Lachnospiraceae bacterium]
MEQLNKLINKITGGRKLRKDQLLIMVLSGILLCIIALPVNNDSKQKTSSKKSDITDNDYDIVEKSAKRQDTLSTTSYPDGDYDLSYTGYWEEKLEQSLACIEGAGDVDVLITLKESETRILEKDIPIEVNETAEEDAEGGKRTVREVQQESVTVYTVNEEGQNVPYVSKIIQPVVEGVVVIAQGGDSAVVKENIIETIQVLFGIDANKIRVVKGKSKY